MIRFMNRFMRLLVLSYFSLSCGTVDHSTPAEFEPFKRTFEENTGHTADGIPIMFSSTRSWQGFGPGNDATAACHFTKFNGRLHDKYITIKASRWYSANRAGKEAIIFHELIHCVLEMQHHTNEFTMHEGFEMPHIMNSELYEDSPVGVEFYRQQLQERYSL